MPKKEKKLTQKQLLRKLKKDNKRRWEEKRRQKLDDAVTPTATPEPDAAWPSPPLATPPPQPITPSPKLDVSNGIIVEGRPSSYLLVHEEKLFKFMNSIATCQKCKKRKKVKASKELGMTKTFTIMKCDQCNIRKEFCTSEKEEKGRMEVHRRVTQFVLKSEGRDTRPWRSCVAMEMHVMNPCTFYKIANEIK